MMGLKSKKSHLSQSSSYSSLAGSSATGSFSVVSRRGHDTPSSSTLSLPSTQDFNQPTRSLDKGKEKDKSMTRISGFFSTSKKGKERQKAAVQASSSPMEPETDAVVPETMSSVPVLPTTVSESRSRSESSSQGRSRSATVKSVAEHPRQPLFVANPDPSSEVSSAEPLSFSASESSSSSTSGYTSQTSYMKSDISSMKGEKKKKKDPLILTFDPSTSTQLTLAATNGAVLNAVPLSHPEEDPPAYTLHPQLQSHPVSSSGPYLENPNSPSDDGVAARLRPKKTLTKPAPLRHISAPALPTQDRPQLPLRAISVPDAEFVTQNGNAMGQILDRIDELDESIPYGVNLHVGGPFDAARTVANNVEIPSSKPSYSQPSFLDPVTTIPYTPFGIPKGGLQVGQVIPRNSLSSQPQHIRHQARPSYTNHHLQPGGAAGPDQPQNRMSTLSLMSALPSPGWPLPSPGFSDDNGPERPSVSVAADSLHQSDNGRVASRLSPVPPAALPRPGHIVEASSSSTASRASSYHTAPHNKPSNRWNADNTPSSNDAFPSNPQTPITPSSANWNTTAYGGIDHENDSRANVRQSQIGLALSSPLLESAMDGHDHRRTPVGVMAHINEDEDEGTERVGMAILMEGSSDDEEAHYAAAVPLKIAAADGPVSSEKDYSSKFSEIRDEDYEYWTGPSGPRENIYHNKSFGYEPMQMDSGKRGWEQSSGTDGLQCHSPYSLLDDKDAVERFGGPPDVAANGRKQVVTTKRSSSLPPTAQTHLGAASPHPVSGPPQPRPPPIQQRSQTMYVPDGRNPPTLFIPTPQLRSLQPSPNGSPYHSNSYSPNHSPAPLHLYPAHMQSQNSSLLEAPSVNQNKHHSLPSSPDWAPRTWTPQGPINAPQNSSYHPHQRRLTNGVNEIRAANRAAVNGHLNRYPDYQRDPTSSTMRSMPLPPGAGAPDPNSYQTQAAAPPPRFTPPSQNPHLHGKNDIPPVFLNRPRHAPTNLVMPAPLQGQGPTNRPRSPYHTNGPSLAQKYPPPPPMPPAVNGSAGKVLRKRSSIAHTTSASTRPMNGGDEWGYMSTGGYASEGAVGRSKTMQSKKAPKRVLSKRRADL
ncbi:hypothetical protein L218DRAFT_210799 [Marasmius fiardii PR-910]|nr:hypothetical protein L218DRAFT_210799 [Marasmius fiardii PR-910]